MVIAVATTASASPPELRAQIFEHVRAGRAPRAARGQRGLGIGLALVRGLVELHGGTRRARASEGPGKGSRFEVRLPLARRSAGARGARSSRAGDRAAGRCACWSSTTTATPPTRCAASCSLYGYEVRAAYDGGAALEVFDVVPPARCVLLDIGMPVLQRLRGGARACARAAAPGLRLIALTGWGAEADAQRAREAGFDQHLTKPADPGVLTRMISRA